MEVYLGNAVEGLDGSGVGFADEELWGLFDVEEHHEDRDERGDRDQKD